MQVPDEDDSPLKQGMAMFCSFMVFGFIPLLAFIAFSAVVTDAEIFAIACVLTACALFGLGAFSSRFNNSHWFRSGLWVLLNGTTASAVAYLVGFALSEIVGSDDCDTLGNFTVTATI
jgi:DNA damage-binding protein 1